ncbi:MAG: chorismate-binding protein [Bacteroidales bacterium]|nr:chorismate-binding protein [Bacteroidales bacterium]
MITETLEKTKISKVQALCLKNNLFFASYRLPQENDIHTIVQLSPQPVILSENTEISEKKGFLVAPFDTSAQLPLYLIQPDLVFTENQITDKIISKLTSTDNNHVDPQPSVQMNPASKEEYIDQINTIIEHIDHGDFEKAVLSRIKYVKGFFTDKISSIFKMLCESYPNAFVYIFKISDHFWMGASPEPLLNSTNGSLKTVSLAATRKFSNKNTDLKYWNQKELNEQEYVTRYIENVLKKLQINEFEKTGPYTKKAGNLLHLRTDFTFPVRLINGRITQLIKELHPTSSICGLPKEETLEFILQLEKHHREYYAGFLGPLNMDEKITLFVNLRCMKVLHDKLALYIGGGITSESKPGDEWEETNIKAETLMAVVRKFI